MDVFDENGSILDEPITGTGGNDRLVEIPLPPDFAGQLTVHVISTGVTTTIDDLGVTVGAPSAVRRLNYGNFGFRYLNPVTERIEVSTDKAVPAGTSATLISSAGQIVGRTAMAGQWLAMETSNLPAGLYFLTISDGSTFSWTGKVMRRK